MSAAAILNYYHQNPLRCILIVALIFRLLAAMFSTGYGMHDDHFITIEVAQSWIDGVNRDQWLPENDKNATPSGHSLTYPGILYGLLLTCEKAGIDDPASKMFLIRLLHALFSLLVVYFGYKIIKEIYDGKSAALAGWLLALFWIFPMLSVRNLVEVVCVPFLMWGIWLIVKNKLNKPILFLWAGIVIGLAFSIRFQTSTFIAGLGLALLFSRNFVHVVLFGIGVVLSMFALQGGVDMIIWKRPFAEFAEYTNYNLNHASEYSNGPWYNYILLVAGLFIPPVGLFVMFGFLKNGKKHLVILLPVLAFFIFHSAFPNKQERFIFPVLPFILMTGAAAWFEFYNSSVFWKRNTKLHHASWIFFVVLNTVLLFALTLSSTKKNRVEAMIFLSKQEAVNCIVIEDSNHDVAVTVPKFYLKKQWPKTVDITTGFSVQQLSNELKTDSLVKPQYVLFMEEKNMDNRVKEFRKYFPSIKYETTIEPSFLDKVMHWLNPVNVNQTTVIYKIS